MTFNGLLPPFYCCVMVGAHNPYGLLVMDIPFVTIFIFLINSQVCQTFIK